MQRLSIAFRTLCPTSWTTRRAWISSNNLQISPIFAAKPQMKIQPTSSPYVWTSEDLDANVLSEELKHPTDGLNKGFAKKLFDRNHMTPGFTSPKDLDYQLPEADIPEIAFIGRSNVGKSTLVGSLIGDLSIVRVSKAPGRTRSILYFALNGKNKDSSKSNNANRNPMCYLIDLPGYGYAKVSKTERNQWEDQLSTFMHTRAQHVLRRTFILIDCRHGPTSTDLELVRLMDDAATPYQLILTKLDLCNRAQMMKSVQATLEVASSRKRRSCLPIVLTVSSKDKLGLDELKWFIAQASENPSHLVN